MRKIIMLCAVLAGLSAGFAQQPPQTSDKRYTASGFGGYPISPAVTSLWLVGPDRRPLLMVYFSGPNDWHKTEWKVASKFEKGKPGWAELKSEKATLRLWVNNDTGEAEIQSGKFKLTENNTFLVLHTGDPLLVQEVVPLGVFDMPVSKEQPAPILLLQAHPALMNRINALVKGEQQTAVPKHE